MISIQQFCFVVFVLYFLPTAEQKDDWNISNWLCLETDFSQQ